MDTSTLLYSLKLSGTVVNRNCDGITQEDSLIHPKPNGQNFNWVLGHMVKVRNEILGLIGKKPLYEEGKFHIYTPKDFVAADALDVSELRESFNALQRELEEGVQSMTAEKLRQPASFTPKEDTKDTIGSLLTTIMWHEAYHAGQLGILRRLAGRPGVIKNPEGE